MSHSTITTAPAIPFPVCVTAFIAPQSLVELSIYEKGVKDMPQGENKIIITVGTYMSDRSISNLGNFSNPSSALKYAFKLKQEKCPISKNAMALIQAEMKRIAEHQKAVEEAEEKKQLPMMKQFNEMKKKHPDALLLFRVGDFYECFNEDAQAAADILGITLATRMNSNKKIFLAGFPHHALDTYLPKIVRAGRRVAICEQLEKPAKVVKKISKKARNAE